MEQKNTQTQVQSSRTGERLEEFVREHVQRFIPGVLAGVVSRGSVRCAHGMYCHRLRPRA